PRVDLFEGDPGLSDQERKGHHDHGENDRPPGEDDVGSEEALEESSSDSAAPRELQQDQARRDRRENERERHESLDDALARPAASGENPREAEAEREGENARHHRHPEGERDDRDVAHGSSAPRQKAVPEKDGGRRGRFEMREEPTGGARLPGLPHDR